MTRKQKRLTDIDPYKNLAADVIIGAIRIVTGQAQGSDKDQAEARCWLRSAQCQRWAGVIGVDIRAALDHRDSQVRIDNADR